LVMMRTWGWEAGMPRLRERLASEATSQAIRGLLDWMDGLEAAAPRRLRQQAALAGWVLLGRAWGGDPGRHFEQGAGRPAAAASMREAAAIADLKDTVLQGAIVHQRGFLLYHAGRLGEAAAALLEALALYGHDHFLTADLLNNLGLVYANKNHFHFANELIN